MFHGSDEKEDKLKDFTYFPGMQIAWPCLQHRLIREIDNEHITSSQSTFGDLPPIKDVRKERSRNEINQSLINDFNMSYNIGLNNTDDLQTLQNYLTFNNGNPFKVIEKMTITDARDLIEFAVTGTDAEDDDKVRHVDISARDNSKWYWDGGDEKYTKHQILKLIGKKYQEDKKFTSKEDFETAFEAEMEKIADLQLYSDEFHFRLHSKGINKGIPEEDKETDSKFDFKIDGKGPYSITWTCGIRGTKHIGMLVHIPIIEHLKSQRYPITRASCRDRQTPSPQTLGSFLKCIERIDRCRSLDFDGYRCPPLFKENNSSEKVPALLVYGNSTENTYDFGRLDLSNEAPGPRTVQDRWHRFIVIPANPVGLSLSRRPEAQP